MKKLFILIPAYNEAEAIGPVIMKIPPVIAGIGQIEKVVIDDGSADDTAGAAKRAGAFVLKHGCNLGVGAALAAGIRYALDQGADIVVNIDADGQFDPLEIPKLIGPIMDNEADFVSGSRFRNGRPRNMPLMKYRGNQWMSKLIGHITGYKFKDVSCGFRAYSREALLNLNLFGNFTYTQETFLNMAFKGLKIKEVPVTVTYYPGRQSKVAGNLLAYGWKTLNIIIRAIIYYKPLRFFGFPGLIIIAVGTVFVVFLLAHWRLTGSFSPYKAYGFIGGGLMLFGLLMIFIGLVADIIDKLRQTAERILYFEKKKFYNKLDNNKINNKINEK